MQRHSHAPRRAQILAALVAAGLGCAAAAAAERTEVTLPGDHVFPESITSTPDGTLIIGSLGMGGIFRVAPGAATAAPWIKPGAGGTMSITGVLADPASNTLWACSSDISAFGAKAPLPKQKVSLVAFDLASGAHRASYPLPAEKAFCNDIAIGPDGAAYITDTMNPYVLRLPKGGHALEVWKQDPGFAGAGLDGIAFGYDGALYVNGYMNGKLYRIGYRDGAAGDITELKTSQPIAHPDGMRPAGTALLLVEGGGKLDRVELSGDTATVTTLKEGYKTPVAVTKVGDTAWLLEGQLSLLFAPKPGEAPGPFRAYAVKLPGA